MIEKGFSGEGESRLLDVLFVVSTRSGTPCFDAKGAFQG